MRGLVNMKQLRIARLARPRAGPAAMQEMDQFLGALRETNFDDSKISPAVKQALMDAWNSRYTQKKETSIMYHLQKYLRRK